MNTMRVGELLVKGREHAVLQGSGAFSANSLLQDVSLEPTWRTAAVCWSRMCCAACLGQTLGDPGGLCWGVPALGQGVTGLCLPPGSLFLTVQSQRGTSQGTWVCLESQFAK